MVAVLAIVVAVAVARTVSQAAATRDALGPTVVVAVMTDGVAAGDAITAAAVRLEPRPVGLVPPGAVTASPVGEIVRAEVFVGEILLQDRLASGDGGVMPLGWRAIAIPRLDVTLPVTTGDRVDVISGAADGVSPALTIVADAVVVEADDHAVVVAVPADRVHRVATALFNGALVLARV